MKDYIRFVAGQSPCITITKWHDLEAREFFYDLYINGKIDGRYSLSGLMKKIQEILIDEV